ncbi:hypothetical protein H257_08289 [Aphanomyces astaci]|uniref:Uncharacterized protein n=1 Tax=Aphanomyces astaci TaxID=112090 RepID=W4GFR3_APHAT|nr:hypothetical protein H257_08289 [Aphanomyces astaci]ETV78081.1 hypothetical protein H257_08289 [Aphanomyces astaci]|eukprot:XP_009832418.1 hypothetical protein H257_08289 [Aphanomyces astaci]
MRHTPQERHPLNRENNSNSPVEVQELDLTSDTNTNFAVFAELPVLEMPSEPDLDGFVFDLDCYLMHGKKSMCIVDGCSRFAQARGKCVGHGGFRACSVDDCVSHARQGGLCQRHRRILHEEVGTSTSSDGDRIHPVDTRVKPTRVPDAIERRASRAAQSPTITVADPDEDEPMEVTLAKQALFMMTELGMWMFEIQI